MKIKGKKFSFTKKYLDPINNSYDLMTKDKVLKQLRDLGFTWSDDLNLEDENNANDYYITED